MKKTNKTALTFLKPYRIRVFLAPLLKIVECITELAVPFIVRSVIDQGLTEPSIGEAYGSHYGDTKYILGLTSLIFVFAIVGFGCTMITQYLAAHVSSEYAYTLKKELYDHLTHASSKQVENYGKGKALNLLTNDSFSMQNGVQLFMRLMVRAPFLVLGSVAAAFFINVYAGLAVLGGLSFCALTIFIVMK
ncbi:MAG: ABC transporter transmembrane domain-containing protein, partial [Candidatus Enteromonas sp.]